MNHVAMVTDRGYAPWCGVAIRSIVEVAEPGTLTVHVLHDGSLSSADEAALVAVGEGQVDVQVVAPPLTALRELPEVGRFGSVVWLRFLLPTALPDVDRVLYLDADVMVTGAIDEVFATDLGGCPVGAVVNAMPASQWARTATLGLVDPVDYFNSGVLLLDLAALRDEPLVERVVDVIEALGERLVWPDQDVLNVVFAGRWQRLDPRFNAQHSFFAWPDLAAAVVGNDARRAAVSDPVIVHFEGPDICKPWNPWSSHPLRDRYQRHLRDVPAAVDAVADYPGLGPASMLPDDLRFQIRKTVDNVRHRPRATAARGARAMRAAVLGGDRPDENWVPEDADERLRPSTVVPHVLSTATPTHRSIVKQSRPFTMVSPERILASIDAVEHVLAHDVSGAFVECGVWRGGSMLAMVLTLLAHDVRDRDIWLYDTFEGMTEPTGEDTSRFDDSAVAAWEHAERAGARMFGDVFAASSFGLGQVQRLLASTAYPPDRLNFVVGPVEDTIPGSTPDRIGVLRLDTDWYESTRHELEHLYPRVSSSGVLIIDDYGHWDGARLATDEYFEGTQRPLLCRTDYSGRMAVK